MYKHGISVALSGDYKEGGSMDRVPVAGVRDWGEAMMTSMTGALAVFLAAIPKIVAFVLILVIGWFIAKLIASGIAVLLRKVHFNSMAERSGLSGFINSMGVRCDAAGFLGETAKWFIRLLALIVAFDALGLPAVSQVLYQLLLWIPNLVVALVVLVIAGLVANWISALVRGATAQAGFSNPNFVASIATAAIWGFGVIIAVNQIGVAATLVNTLFMGLIGALALALGLAFGLGGRDTAGEIVREWYQQGRQSAARINNAAEFAEAEARDPGSVSDPRSIHGSTFER
jgi:Conserved TM helix